MADVETDIEEAIFALLAARKERATICPSEASRRVFGGEAGLEKQAILRTRAVAAKLAAAGRLEVTQKGRVIDVATAKGPIRLRLPS